MLAVENSRTVGEASLRTSSKRNVRISPVSTVKIGVGRSRGVWRVRERLLKLHNDSKTRATMCAALQAQFAFSVPYLKNLPQSCKFEIHF